MLEFEKRKYLTLGLFNFNNADLFIIGLILLPHVDVEVDLLKMLASFIYLFFIITILRVNKKEA